MTTGYVAMKTHFDKLLKGEYSNNYFRGAEPIRSTYEKAFGQQINMYNIHETSFKVESNPCIKSLISIVGPITDDRVLPEGIMMCDSGIAHVSVFDTEINKGIMAENIDSYVNTIYGYMDAITRSDSFYQPEPISRSNPYMKLIRMIPFYFTFHHIKEYDYEYLRMPIFHLLLEKYILSDNDCIDKLLTNLSKGKCSSDPCVIYNAMTVNGELEDELLY